MIPSQPHIASNPKGKHVPAPHHTRASIHAELDCPSSLLGCLMYPLGRGMSPGHVELS
jgi:hypothetical protein